MNNILLDKITKLELKADDRDAQVLEVCGILNTPQPIAPLTKTNHKLKPLLIPHLIEEKLLVPEKLQALATHPICSDFLKALVREHYNGATELTPTIEQLVAAGRTFMVLTEADAQAVRDRLDIDKVVEIDAAKPLDQRRYTEWIEEVPQESVSWSQLNLGRAIDGDEVLQILGELYGSQKDD
jgi:hypothetical protein